jgi:SAM-dependent methyltransferase
MSAGPIERPPSPLRAGIDLFLISLLILFLELACIRWFPAHVLFLTFFTNIVLLACFLGMSVGCLAASRKISFLGWTPLLLALAMLVAHRVEALRASNSAYIDVGRQASPQLVFFGTEYHAGDVARSAIPVEALAGFFFLVIALALVGPGQELGRAFGRLPNRVAAYTINIFGSIVGIVLFAGISWFHLSPLWWFLPVALGLGYFVLSRAAFGGIAFRACMAASTLAVLLLGAKNTTELARLRSDAAEPGVAESLSLWSPYYRVDYIPAPRRIIVVNLIGHQNMIARDQPFVAYALPYALNRDAGGTPVQDVLIMGAGSGNDVSRALQWGAQHVDAVEIDPVIYELGRRDHPDHPYQDPRVEVHLDDGRNFLHSSDRKYDLIVYALVDSLVLHSSYSNIRLESYLFTEQALADVRRHLKPGGSFVMYNFFRQGWIVARLHQGLTHAFGTEPAVLTLPYLQAIDPETKFDGFTMFISGDSQAIERVRGAFQRHPEYWLQDGAAPVPTSPNGFTVLPEAERARWRDGPELSEREESNRGQPGWQRFGLAEVTPPQESLRPATDDWPYLYLRKPMVPDLSIRGMLIMGGIALFLLLIFRPRPDGTDLSPARVPLAELSRMFFLGAGFMLVETKAVVHMALLFGSTWMVNSVVFFAVLVMILGANLFVLALRPRRLAPYYLGLIASLLLNALVPLDSFLGMGRALQVVLSCLLVFAPILFAGVIFAVSFGRSTAPDRALGANIAGAMVGGLMEYTSMVIGFQYLVLVALVFYLLSTLQGRSPEPKAAEPRETQLEPAGLATPA